MVEDVIDKYAQNQMPLETVYLDIPYMNNYADFTVNETAFPKLYELADRLHNNSQKLVLIVDAAISAEDASANNTYFTMGQKDNIFIKSSMYKSDKYNNTLLAKVWPEVAVFVDWWNPKCMNMWSTGLKDLYDKVQYDGLWIDMNEPTTFNHGELDHSKVKTSTQTPRFL
jgi:alpha-glucosidase